MTRTKKGTMVGTKAALATLAALATYLPLVQTHKSVSAAEVEKLNEFYTNIGLTEVVLGSNKDYFVELTPQLPDKKEQEILFQCIDQKWKELDEKASPVSRSSSLAVNSAGIIVYTDLNGNTAFNTGEEFFYTGTQKEFPGCIKVEQRKAPPRVNISYAINNRKQRQDEKKSIPLQQIANGKTIETIVIDSSDDVLNFGLDANFNLKTKIEIKSKEKVLYVCPTGVDFPMPSLKDLNFTPVWFVFTTYKDDKVFESYNIAIHFSKEYVKEEILSISEKDRFSSLERMLNSDDKSDTAELQYWLGDLAFESGEDPAKAYAQAINLDSKRLFETYDNRGGALFGKTPFMYSLITYDLLYSGVENEEFSENKKMIPSLSTEENDLNIIHIFGGATDEGILNAKLLTEKPELSAGFSQHEFQALLSNLEGVYEMYYGLQKVDNYSTGNLRSDALKKAEDCFMRAYNLSTKINDEMASEYLTNIYLAALENTDNNKQLDTLLDDIEKKKDLFQKRHVDFLRVLYLQKLGRKKASREAYEALGRDTRELFINNTYPLAYDIAEQLKLGIK